jgi:hypothetical protein
MPSFRHEPIADEDLARSCWWTLRGGAITTGGFEADIDCGESLRLLFLGVAMDDERSEKLCLGTKASVVLTPPGSIAHHKRHELFTGDPDCLVFGWLR